MLVDEFFIIITLHVVNNYYVSNMHVFVCVSILIVRHVIFTQFVFLSCFFLFLDGRNNSQKKYFLYSNIINITREKTSESNKKLHRIFQCALVLRALCNVLIFSLKLCSIHLSTRHSHTYPTIFKPYQFTAFSSYPVYSIWTFVVGFFPSIFHYI